VSLTKHTPVFPLPDVSIAGVTEFDSGISGKKLFLLFSAQLLTGILKDTQLVW